MVDSNELQESIANRGGKFPMTF